jgi:hypothetical protein
VASEGSLSQEQQHRLDRQLRAASEAQRWAWQILEHVKHESTITAAWIPIAVFYAGLVVWRAVRLQIDSGSPGSLKVLTLF